MRREKSSRLSTQSKKVILPFFLTHTGCAGRCSYCDQNVFLGSSPGGGNPFPDFKNRMSLYRAIPDEIALYGGDLLNLSDDRIESILGTLRGMTLERFGSIVPFRISGTPGAVLRGNLDQIKRLGVRTVEVGVVSTDAHVLGATGRGYSPADAVSAINAVVKKGFHAGVQLVTGLPHDSCERFYKTLTETLSCRPDFARLYPLVVVKGTPLGIDFTMKRYIPPPGNTILKAASLFILMCKKWGVNIARIGVYDSEMETGNVLYSSPFYNLRQEAEGRVYRTFLEYYHFKVKKIDAVRVHKGRETSMRGKKNENLKKIEESLPGLSGKIHFRWDVEGGVELKGRGDRFVFDEPEDEFYEYATKRIMEM